MRWVLTMVVALTLLSAVPALAADDESLPSFTVRTATGETVASNALTTESKWLLIYVAPGCRPCDTLMHAMPRWTSQALLNRVVLVVGGPAEKAAEWIAAGLPAELSTMRWYVDAGREARTALGLQGAPVFIGVKDGQVEWQVAGVLGDPAAIESVVRSWVER